MKPGWVWSRAHLGIAGQAVLDTPAAADEGHRDAITDAATSDARTDLRDHACELMPGMCGSATGSWPFQACQSDRHTPVAPTVRTTPASGQAGSATSMTVGGIP